jgi:hypothetical protein
MSGRSEIEATLHRLALVKRREPPPADALGPEMVAFFKQSVEKRNARFSKIASSWTHLVPEMLAEHCALESFSRGALTVLVGSSSHLYELKQLLLAGLQQQLLQRVKDPPDLEVPTLGQCVEHVSAASTYTAASG